MDVCNLLTHIIQGAALALGQSYGTRDVIWKDMCSNKPQINTKKHWPSAYLLALGAILFLVVNSLAPGKFEWNLDM